MGIFITDRHAELVQISAIVREAVAIPIDEERFATAVEWLEEGRAVVWNQMLQLRTPLDDLRAASPDLANSL